MKEIYVCAGCQEQVFKEDMIVMYFGKLEDTHIYCRKCIKKEYPQLKENEE